MNTADLPVLLADRETMENQLRAVNDNKRVIDRFYPGLLALAGQMLSCRAVCTAIVEAYCHYTHGMLEERALIVAGNMHSYVDAMVEAPSEADDVKATLDAIVERFEATHRA